MKVFDPNPLKKPEKQEIWLYTGTEPAEMRLILEVMDPNESPFFGKVVYMSLLKMCPEHNTLFWWMKEVRDQKLCLVSDHEV